MKKHQNSGKLSVIRENFLNDISNLIHPLSPEGTRFLNYLEVTARQLAIRDFDAQEIISEAVMRGLIALSEKDQKIQNPQAWLRQVCTYIICDRVKEQKKTRLLKEKTRDISEVPDSFSHIVSHEQHKVVIQAYSKLSEEDQKILDLRFYQGLPYKEIQQQYLTTSGRSVKIPTLRKRESRALQRLRVKFQEEYE